jgi:misacylated tRNA(Ala) deacylase
VLTELLFQKDSYLKEFNAKLLSIQESNIVLDRTAFHPLTGGVDCDLGSISTMSETYRIVKVTEDKVTGNVLHNIEEVPKIKIGDNVTGSIDWARRYKLMKLHTAAHILSSILFKKYGAYVTGGHIDAEHAKDDFNLESSDKSVFDEAVRETNEVISRGAEVKIYFLSREEALKIPGIIKLAQRAPPNINTLRIVEIQDVDIQADGGPHVANIKEISGITIEKVENKGKGRKRVYYKLS